LVANCTGRIAGVLRFATAPDLLGRNCG
jgi:hypothetical protein